MFDIKVIIKKKIEKIVNYPSPLTFDLLDEMLVFNPDKRINIENSFNNFNSKNIREGIEDPFYKGSFNFDYDNNITLDSLIKLLIKEGMILNLGLFKRFFFWVFFLEIFLLNFLLLLLL